MTQRWILHVILPLAAGAALYLAFRACDIRLFAWVSALGLGDAARALRLATSPLRDSVPRWLSGSGPDFAWAYAFGASLGLVWRHSPASRAAWIWIWLGAAVTSGLELAQAFHVIEGRFDALDLFAMLGGFGLALYAVRLKAPLFARVSRRPVPAAPRA